jgi:hypothetical protein
MTVVGRKSQKAENLWKLAGELRLGSCLCNRAAEDGCVFLGLVNKEVQLLQTTKISHLDMPASKRAGNSDLGQCTDQ